MTRYLTLFCLLMVVGCSSGVYETQNMTLRSITNMQYTVEWDDHTVHTIDRCAGAAPLMWVGMHARVTWELGGAINCDTIVSVQRLPDNPPGPK